MIFWLLLGIIGFAIGIGYNVWIIMSILQLQEIIDELCEKEDET